jgi:D-alanyl-D-alanine carboxypeptidase/D-alanyl-D-alanine-endopeptidase (penicillin-binding protein 4)
MRKYVIIFLLFTVNILNANSREETVNRIREILSSLPSGTNAGIVIYDPLIQDTIFAFNAKEPMIPASLTKLFTTSTSLSLMNGDYKISTKLFSDDQNLDDGVVNGSLYLKGFGNSTFTENDLQSMIDFLLSRGIRKIEGNIIGDDTYFDNIYTREDWIEDEKANVKLPAISALVLDRNKTVVRQKIRRRYRYVSQNFKDPPLFIANKFKDMLKTSGIEITGSAKKGATPEKTYLITESNIQLSDLIGLINKHSDNFFAECLFKTLGAVSSGLQGNSLYSQQAIQKFIKGNNIYAEGTEIVDGSGISRFDQVTPLAIAGILEKMYFDLNHFDDFYNSLSIAGVDGTLRNRLNGTSAENNFRGKTGSLNGVSGLAGYLKDAGGDELIVTIIFEYNRGGQKYYRNIQDKIVSLLADWKNERSNQ